MKFFCGFITFFLLAHFYTDAVEESPETPCILAHPRLVSELHDAVKTDNGRKAVKAEFHRVLEGQRKPWTAGTKQENLAKNRYSSLLAYDDTRVVLHELRDDPNSNYINANYMNGYNREKEYVATQGPLPNTVNDFWRMVWQLNSSKIIVLANVYEDGKKKMEKYWPDESQNYGDINVETLSEKDVNGNKIRSFQLVKKGLPARRLVKQFHFTGWPDLSVPTDRLSYSSLLELARSHNPTETAPIIVHCSAGVGRTGTTILTDSMLQSALKSGKVDFLRRLEEMRNQRVDVVEKEDQYLFAHEVVYDAVTSGQAEKMIGDAPVDANNNSPLDIDESMICVETDSGSKNFPLVLLILFSLWCLL